MKKLFLAFLTSLVVAFFFTKDILFEHFGITQETNSEIITPEEPEEETKTLETFPNGDYFVDETIFRWDETVIDWVKVEDTTAGMEEMIKYPVAIKAKEEPIELDWNLLMNIEYRLRYFAQIDMEMYAPVFGNEIEELDGKEVVIEGFVIPIDHEGELLSLSHYPFASCFFCGKASPASVISMYLKNQRKRYKMDDFIKFRGTLHLNYDDPDEFYYILRDAREEK
ncbi:MAG: hypothetical protein AAF502_16405 [Bacteroidota bacterium]